jgi:hypothetical protein
MSRTRFAQHLLLAFLLCLRNAGQLAFLADGRRRARKASA